MDWSVFPLSFALGKSWGRDGGDEGMAARREGDLCFFGSDGRMLVLLRCGSGFVNGGLSAPTSLCAVP